MTPSIDDEMPVTETVFEQYQQVQRAGPCNMTDKRCVQQAADDMGLDELFIFIDAGDYYALLMNYDEYAERFGGD